MLNICMDQKCPNTDVHIYIYIIDYNILFSIWHKIIYEEIVIENIST